MNKGNQNHNGARHDEFMEFVDTVKTAIDKYVASGCPVKTVLMVLRVMVRITELQNKG